MDRAGDAGATELSDQLQAYLAERVGKPIQIDGLVRLAGGASNETWGFDARVKDAETLPLVMRKAFTAGLLDESMVAEFDLMVALFEHHTPVPRPRWCESAESSPLGGAFMIMDRASGTDVRKAMAKGQVQAESMGRSLAEVQAQVHRINYHELPVNGKGEGHFSERQVAIWSEKFDRFETGHWPLLSLACQWLKDNIPQLDRPVLVHGDFKANNLLCDQGQLTAVIDWEMAHIGDPIEDLAWTMLWQSPYDIVGGMLSESEYVRLYEELTDSVVLPRRLLFWKIFSWLKLGIIFLSGLAPGEAQHPRPMLLQLGRAIASIEQKLAANLMQTHEQVFAP